MGTGKNRIIWMDVLNIIACFCVIVLHVSNHAVHSFNGKISSVFLWGVTTHSFLLWPVPIFLMLSGCNTIVYQGSYKEFYKKRFKKIGIPFIAWSLIYAFLFRPSFPSWQDYIATFLNGHYNYHMWFFIPLFALYLSVPFLKAMLDHLTRRLLYLLIVFAAVFNSILPYILGILHVNEMNYELFPVMSNLLMYGVLGYLVVRKDFFIYHKKIVYGLSIFSSIISFALLYWGLVHGYSSKPYTTYASPFLLIISVGILILFKEIKWEPVLSKFSISPRIISYISQCSFGVYLVHQLFRRISDHYHWIITNPYYGAFFLYLISLIFVICLKKIPLIKRIVP